MKQILITIIILTFAGFAVFAQTETLTNALIIEMSKIGLDTQIILKKINDTPNDFDVSAESLIALKKAGIDNEIITLMLEKSAAKVDTNQTNQTNQTNYSETQTSSEISEIVKTIPTPKEALFNAKTVAIEKSSVQPSRQSLEKSLFKSKEWQKYNLTLTRYKQDADIYIEIGYVSFSWLTHRYVFRIYDRKSGTIITAGETTSWGNLSANLAREITQKMNLIAGN